MLTVNRILFPTDFSPGSERALDTALALAEEVVRFASCPVLTVGSGEGTSAFPSTAPLLVPVDFSEHSRQALIHARELAATVGAEIYVFHVFERPIHPELYLGGMPLDSPDFRTVEGSLREALETFVRETPGKDVATSLHVVEGRAVPAILEFVQDYEVGLVVIATHGLTGLAHVLLGSVSEKVVRRATSPVLSVKPFGKSLLA